MPPSRLHSSRVRYSKRLPSRKRTVKSFNGLSSISQCLWRRQCSIEANPKLGCRAVDRHRGRGQLYIINVLLSGIHIHQTLLLKTVSGECSKFPVPGTWSFQTSDSNQIPSPLYDPPPPLSPEKAFRRLQMNKTSGQYMETCHSW